VSGTRRFVGWRWEERHDLRTADVVFVSVIVLSFLLLGAGVFVGFGFATACTDVPGNGGVGQAPCNRVGLAIKLNTVLQAAFFVIAWLGGGRSRSRAWMAWTLLVASLIVFIVSIAIADSY
jgi:hypothetical protein